MNGSRTLFGIIRHAPTLWNEEKRIQGQQDSPLTPTGEKMAGVWGKELGVCKWDSLLCSDLQRAMHTCELINLSLHLPVRQDKRLREQDWGDWAGMTLQDLKLLDRALIREQEQRGWDFRPPGGESRREVLARSLAALSDAHAVETGRKILVVCHEGVMKCLLYHLLGRRFLPDEPKVLLGYHLHMLSMADSTLTLDKLNCITLAAFPGGKED